MEIICLSGFARSGKDTAANVLVEKYGFKKLAFADKLRQFLYATNPIIGTYGGDTVYLQDWIDEHSWEGAKDTFFAPEIRRLMQKCGTEAGRQVVGQDIWVDSLLNNLTSKDAKVVIPDARFLNEFDKVREHKGYVWRIDREGVGPANNHSSETEAIGYDFFSLYLQNNGTQEEFEKLVSKEYESGRYKEWC